MVGKLSLDGERLTDVTEATEVVAKDFRIELDEGEQIETVRFRDPTKLARLGRRGGETATTKQRQ